MPSPTVPLSVEYELIVGAPGATVSTVTLRALEAALTLPAASLAVAVKLWVEIGRASGRDEEELLPLAVAVPKSVAPSKPLTVAQVAAVPVNVSVLSLVMPSPTVPLSVEYELIVGAPGATVSTVTLRAPEAALTLPAASLAVAVKLWV